MLAGAEALAVEVDVDVLASRVLLHPADAGPARRFYRDVLGLAVFREFGDPADPGVVFFLGGGYLEVAPGGGAQPASPRPAPVSLWLQVRDVAAEHERLSGLGVEVLRGPQREPWGLIEAWIADPDGTRIVLVEVPDDHPLRRDQRAPTTTEQH